MRLASVLRWIFVGKGGWFVAEALRYGWTTGACSAAASLGAARGLAEGIVPDHVDIVLPRGRVVSFACLFRAQGSGWCEVGVVKDAGDDPDVTHGAMVCSRVGFGAAPADAVPHISLNDGRLVVRGGEGIGVVECPGLPVAVGEPAINPAPRRLLEETLRPFVEAQPVWVELSIPGGAALALKTWNPRLGIRGGLSILGTTGIVRPYSCSAWIASIHSGIDVARALGHTHLAGSTGSTSESVARRLYPFPETALLDMGDFVGGTLKYLRRHPVSFLTLCGGFGKFSKLAQGAMDLHSARSQVSLSFLSEQLADLGAPESLVAKVCEMQSAGAVLHAAQSAGAHGLPQRVADLARAQASEVLAPAAVAVEVVVIDRAGAVLARSTPADSVAELSAEASGA